MVCLENTHNGAGGAVTPLHDLRELTAVARGVNLPVHLDGARLWNAAVATGTSLADFAACADTVMVAFSKGLGAPVGSVLVGSSALIKEARRWRKVLGGGMRQAGVLAAAGLYALEHHVSRLADDHLNAQALAEGLRGIPGLEVETPQTNIVWVDVAQPLAARLVPELKEKGVLATGSTRVRFVTHLDVTQADIVTAIAAVRAIAI